jgi:hypothetical protein
VLQIVPLTIKQANVLVKRWHRHHKPVQGARFAIGARVGNELIGAAIVGRPVARKTNQYEVAEVTRLVTNGTRNACSKLYGAAARAAKEMGFSAIQTFILDDEGGVSLKAAGWQELDCNSIGPWTRDDRDTESLHLFQKKRKFIKVLTKGITG